MPSLKDYFWPKSKFYFVCKENFLMNNFFKSYIGNVFFFIKNRELKLKRELRSKTTLIRAAPSPPKPHNQEQQNKKI